MNPGKRLILISIAAIICAPFNAASGNSLADAMSALESDSIGKALELSTVRQSNPWLEIYRLLVRAEAFLAAEDSANASGQALSALKIIFSGEAGGHPEGGRLADIAIKARGPEVVLPWLTDENPVLLSPLSLLLMARHYLEIGDSSAAALCITNAARGIVGEEEMAILNEMAVNGTLSVQGVSVEVLAAFASAAISAEDDATAQRLMILVGSTGEYSWLADILEADLLASSGKKKKALVLYTSIFRSGTCPVEGKKKALRRIAALQYRMKRFRNSSDSYRMYGLYYPDDPFAEVSTDRAARIEVSSGRWDSAVKIWKTIADEGPETMTGREAILGMAVSLDRMGRKSEACDILKDNLQKVSGRLRAAYLYWIVRSCDDDRLRSDHAMILNGECAPSFYSRVREGGPEALNVTEVRNDLSVADHMEVATRKEPFPSIGTMVDHHSLGAFRYFTGEGNKAAAADCARGYLTTIEGQDSTNGIGIIYREARKAGLESLCLELAVANRDLFDGREDYIEFLYPFAFGHEVDEGSDKQRLPPEMVLAVIREESRLDENVMSPAGAWGLMQIMPSTGEWIGGKFGRRDISESDLRDPGFNIAAGCWYLRFLLDRAEGSIVAALAAYNAGHGRMRTWKKKFRPHTDPLAALELIGPSETRRYVRRTLDSMEAYGRQTSRHVD